MIEKIEQQFKSEKSKLGQPIKPIYQTREDRQSIQNKLIFFLLLIKTGLFLILLLVVGVFSIPFAILASQVDKRIENDRQ